jgi:hypothetical protein
MTLDVEANHRNGRPCTFTITRMNILPFRKADVLIKSVDRIVDAPAGITAAVSRGFPTPGAI